MGFTPFSSNHAYTIHSEGTRTYALDLSFTRFERVAEVTVLPADLAVLMVGVVARQASSTTATAEAAFTRTMVDPLLFAPLDGAFNGAMASALMRWKEQ